MKKNRQLTKKQSQYYHFKSRMMERYGARVTRKTYKDMLESISTGEAPFIERQSNRVTVHMIHYAGKDIPAVYDSKRHSLVTVLV